MYLCMYIIYRYIHTYIHTLRNNAVDTANNAFSCVSFYSTRSRIGEETGREMEVCICNRKGHPPSLIWLIYGAQYIRYCLIEQSLDSSTGSIGKFPETILVTESREEPGGANK